MGFWKGFWKVNLGILTFLGGYSYSRYVNRDQEYTIERYHNTPYLVDKINNEKLEIHEETFQTGTLEYRVLGILDDPTLQELLEELNHDR
jgi:hypothetical protein